MSSARVSRGLCMKQASRRLTRQQKGLKASKQVAPKPVDAETIPNDTVERIMKVDPAIITVRLPTKHRKADMTLSAEELMKRDPAIIECRGSSTSRPVPRGPPQKRLPLGLNLAGPLGLHSLPPKDAAVSLSAEELKRRDPAIIECRGPSTSQPIPRGSPLKLLPTGLILVVPLGLHRAKPDVDLADSQKAVRDPDGVPFSSAVTFDNIKIAKSKPFSILDEDKAPRMKAKSGRVLQPSYSEQNRMKAKSDNSSHYKDQENSPQTHSIQFQDNKLPAKGDAVDVVLDVKGPVKQKLKPNKVSAEGTAGASGPEIHIYHQRRDKNKPRKRREQKRVESPKVETIDLGHKISQLQSSLSDNEVPLITAEDISKLPNVYCSESSEVRCDMCGYTKVHHDLHTNDGFGCPKYVARSADDCHLCKEHMAHTLEDDRFYHGMSHIKNSALVVKDVHTVPLEKELAIGSVAVRSPEPQKVHHEDMEAPGHSPQSSSSYAPVGSFRVQDPTELCALPGNFETRPSANSVAVGEDELQEPDDQHPPSSSYALFGSSLVQDSTELYALPEEFKKESYAHNVNANEDDVQESDCRSQKSNSYSLAGTSLIQDSNDLYAVPKVLKNEICGCNLPANGGDVGEVDWQPSSLSSCALVGRSHIKGSDISGALPPRIKNNPAIELPMKATALHQKVTTKGKNLNDALSRETPLLVARIKFKKPRLSNGEHSDLARAAKELEESENLKALEASIYNQIIETIVETPLAYLEDGELDFLGVYKTYEDPIVQTDLDHKAGPNNAFPSDHNICDSHEDNLDELMNKVLNSINEHLPQPSPPVICPENFQSTEKCVVPLDPKSKSGNNAESEDVEKVPLSFIVVCFWGILASVLCRYCLCHSSYLYSSTFIALGGSQKMRWASIASYEVLDPGKGSGRSDIMAEIRYAKACLAEAF
ncbi:hypothetical protein BT63DRAFT_450163 [Microthyrium microscopicum]|uniref:Uncharacterized protein n=1 Tax=Microthyrium microscopicum TaxID=703497 RepID=A0A6A6UTN9_9PEZI|nr:hypothetical protein BT63DRAFT_450163 [Microthyrium microscopicum]